MDEPAAPKPQRGAALRDALAEDLELYGVGELRERLVLLEADMARTRSMIDKKASGRAAADAIFSFKSR